MASRTDNEIIASQIEQYLTRVAGHLYGANPQAVNDALEEICQHLTASSEVFILDGLDADQAAQRAIQRFGSSNKIGASLARHLTVYGFPIGVYRALWACHCTIYAGFVLGVLQMIGWNAWSAIIIATGMASTVLQLSQRFKTQPKFSGSFSLRIVRLLRELQRQNIAGIVNLAGRRHRLFIFNMIILSLSFIHSHSYGFLGISSAVILEFVLIRRTASRLGAHISA